MNTCTKCGGQGRIRYDHVLKSNPHLAVAGEAICETCSGSGFESPQSVDTTVNNGTQPLDRNLHSLKTEDTMAQTDVFDQLSHNV